MAMVKVENHSKMNNGRADAEEHERDATKISLNT